VYGYNRFLACRFGLSAEIIDPYTRTRRPLAEDVTCTIDAVLPFAQDAAAREALEGLQDDAHARRTHSGWLREQFAQTESLREVVRRQAERWSQAN
jgi:carboxylate-amine ligase